MKIPTTLIPLAYKISRDVYDGKLKKSEGAKLLSKNEQMNINSAQDYISNFRCLMNGEVFYRTLNTASMEYFFSNMVKDYGEAYLRKPLFALMQHIQYYEGQQQVNMLAMRDIYDRYAQHVNHLLLINNLEQLIVNIQTVESYLARDNERQKTLDLIKKGICFVAYNFGGELKFAPSRFIGYINNNLELHANDQIDGRETNPAISRLLGNDPVADALLDKKYQEYCASLNINSRSTGSFGIERKFWILNFEEGDSQIELTRDFPEGVMIERLHKVRERDPRLIEQAKSNFKAQHGKLICQICSFDFEEHYGDCGKDFIEGHHTKPVSEMVPGYKSKPEEIALLCSNCHRMVHRRRPWLTMEKLAEVLMKKR